MVLSMLDSFLISSETLIPSSLGYVHIMKKWAKKLEESSKLNFHSLSGFSGKNSSTIPFKHATNDPGIFYFRHNSIILKITMNYWLSILWWITSKEVQKLRMLLSSGKLIPSGWIFILQKEEELCNFSSSLSKIDYFLH